MNLGACLEHIIPGHVSGTLLISIQEFLPINNQSLVRKDVSNIALQHIDLKSHLQSDYTSDNLCLSSTFCRPLSAFLYAESYPV